MIVLKPRFSFDWAFSFAQACLLLMAFAAVLLYFASGLHHNPRETMMIEGSLEKQVPLEDLLSGPLGLKENTQSTLALSLEQKLVLLAQSVRPGWGEDDRAFRIGVEGSNQQKIVKEGEAIYCQLNLHPSGGAESVAFTESEGSVKLIPHVLDNRSLKLSVQKAGNAMFEILLKAGKPQSSFSHLPEIIGQLQTAKWWGQDRFFSTYGGDIYHEMGTKQKLEVGQQVLYVNPGDFLTLDGDTWKVVPSLDMARSDAPLGRVSQVGRNQLEVEVWDEKGFSLFEKCLDRESGFQFHSNPSTLFKDPKRRTAQGISCKIGGKRWIIKTGDWLLSTDSGLRKLQTEEEIAAYLNHQTLGELIVVDSLDQNGLLSGHIIDMSRTVSQPFSIQVASVTGKKGRTRR